MCVIKYYTKVGDKMVLPEYTAILINIFLIITLIIAIYTGYKKGFISQVIGFFSLILSGLIAWMLYVPFGKLFSILPKNLAPFQTTSLENFFYIKSNSILWYIIIFIVSLIIIKFISKVLDIISQAPIINIINRLLGVGFSFINFAMIVWLLIFALSLPIFSNGKDMIDKSFLKYKDQIVALVLPIIDESLNELQSTQSIIKKPQQATTADIENMQKWLLKNKVSLEEVLSFFKEIKDE